MPDYPTVPTTDYSAEPAAELPTVVPQAEYPSEPPPTYNQQTQGSYVVPGSTTTFTPAYGFSPATAPPGMTVVTSQPLSSVSTRITCPHCLADVNTNVSYEITGMTHCLACVLCCFVCWPCAWVPYVTDCTKDANHECPNCQRHLGTYKR